MTQNSAIAWEQARATFRQIWGYPDFRPPQGEIVQSLLTGQDTLIIMPTGGGKSICFQLPALLRQGLTLVVSPLVALMENQVEELRQRQLPAACLHGELPAWERRNILKALEQQRLRLLYLSPETLLSPAVWQRLCQPHIQLNGLVLDEAHCLAQWGDTFRPAYYRLGAVRSTLLQQRPGQRLAIAAFTATANPQDQQTIERILQLQQPQIFRLNPYRANLHLTVQTVWSARGRRQRLLQFLQAQGKQTGLVYVRTRRDSETLAQELTAQGYRTAPYHAGLGARERRQVERDWLEDRTQFVVCTCAFGMGINKSNCRWVVHLHAPLLLSEYVQEVGRAGRDGKPAIALTLASEATGWLDPEDKQRWQFFAAQASKQQRTARQLAAQLPRQGTVEQVMQQFPEGAIALSLLHGSGQLEWRDPFHYVLTTSQSPNSPQNGRAGQEMSRFLHSRHCRWSFLLTAFGFSAEATGMRCGHCDNCRRNQS